MSKSCNQANCKNLPVLRFTWPGKDEAYICAIHSIRLLEIAQAMGLYIQLIPLTTQEMDE